MVTLGFVARDKERLVERVLRSTPSLTVYPKRRLSDDKLHSADHRTNLAILLGVDGLHMQSDPRKIFTWNVITRTTLPSIRFRVTCLLENDSKEALSLKIAPRLRVTPSIPHELFRRVKKLLSVILCGKD